MLESERGEALGWVVGVGMMTFVFVIMARSVQRAGKGRAR